MDRHPALLDPQLFEICTFCSWWKHLFRYINNNKTGWQFWLLHGFVKFRLRYFELIGTVFFHPHPNYSIIKLEPQNVFSHTDTSPSSAKGKVCTEICAQAWSFFLCLDPRPNFKTIDLTFQFWMKHKDAY